ncbi:serine/threonine-protein kinase [Nonomuraea sp. NPDC050680]|uniref:serine/threonine-protein kinase n=1 Tax=Nonomuraea sp. NPDC050680 TaxID=3154630 RepID=UPI0033D22076
MYDDHGQWGVPGYSEIRELGAGSAGRVVLARRDHDGLEVAVKYLSDELRSDVGFVARFRHEARLLGTMRSPHNARLIDYVESGAGAAIVMELVNGVSLRELLRSEGPTGPEAALLVLKGSLQGLAAAHAIGVVHRDFKPENVMVQGDGSSKLVDFGIAVRTGEDASAAGTPPYMAPEQWSGASAAPATDVYAATIVFFECLTGARPFRSPNLAALARQHQSSPPPIEEVPGPLRNLVERGLAKNALDRPPSAEAFLTELEAVAARAYGSDWEERGRRRLARLSGLLLMLFPSPPEVPAEVRTSLAETRFTEPRGLLSRLSTKILVGTACTGLLIGVAVVLVKTMSDEPALQAQTTQVTPTTTAPEPSAAAEEEEEEPSEEPTPTVKETTPEPTPTASTAPPPVTSATPKPKPTPTPTPTRKPTRTVQPRPSKTTIRTPPPVESSEPEFTGTVDDPPPGATSATTKPPTTAPPTVRPTRTLSSPPPSSDPPSTPSSPGEGSGEGSTRTPSPQDGALLGLVLVTSGALPVTLAVKRRMAGRHRRKH